MSANDLSLFAGVLLSLAFSYVPGLKDWYEAREATEKRLVMLGALCAVVLAAALLSCGNVIAVIVCGQAGFLELARALVLAMIANQATYLITPKAVVIDAKKLALLLLPVPLLFLSATTTYADSDNAPLPASTFPGAELYCLAAATHTEAASQSAPTKAAVARWILVRAIETRQTVCGMLQSERTVVAAHAPAGTWAHDVFHNGDLLRRQRGAESWLIAIAVYDSAGIGEAYDHFDSCDSRAAWTDAYERVRLEPTDSVCMWR